MRRIRHNYDELYAGDTSPPWDIGKPQPALAALIDRKGSFQGIETGIFVLLAAALIAVTAIAVTRRVA